MSFQKIISIVLPAAFVVSACYLMFYSPYNTRKKQINGEVMMIWKPEQPRSSWIIELREKESITVVLYEFPDNVITIHEGNSLRKSQGSARAFLRPKNSSEWIELDNSIDIRN